MKRELEKSLKRYLKRKVRITLGFVTAFAIMGNVGLASEAIEGSLDWSMEKAKEWTEGYGGSNKIKEIAGDRVSISGTGEIKLDDTVLVTVPQTNISNKVLTNINNTADLLDKNINGNTEVVIGKDADGNEIVGYNEGLALQNNGEIAEKDTAFEISGEGNIFVNDGDLNKSQKSLEGATIVNKGEIDFEGKYGQSIGKNGIGYNYGVIVGSYGQNISGVGYNYGLITSTLFGQYIGENKNANSYNYGIINNSAGTSISNRGLGEAYNYGVVKNDVNRGTAFENVTNYGIVIFNDSTNGKIGTGTNKGVGLDSSYNLISGNTNIDNSHVIDLSSTGSINGDNKTYYTKDNTIDFSQDLTGNVLTAVITDTTGNKVAYNYTGSDELILNDSVVTGYFTDGGEGTLLNVSDGKDLVLVDTTINAVTDIENRNNVTAIKLDRGTLTQIGDSQIVGKIEGQGTLNYVASQSKEQAVGIDGELILRNATNEEATQYNITDNRTDISFSNLETEKLVLNFVENTEGKEANEIVLGDNVVIGKALTETLTTTNSVIDGSSSTEKIDLTINNITGIHGDIALGNNDDTLTIAEKDIYSGIIDLGSGNDTLNISHINETLYVKNEGNTFDYKVSNVENINLQGGHWHIDKENVEITGDKVNLNVASGELHVELNSLGIGKGVETSMDGVGAGVEDFTVTASEGIRYVIGDNFNALEPSYSFETEYKLGTDTEIKGAVIFDTSASTATENSPGHINIRVKEADEMGLGDYAAIYDTVIRNLSGNDELRTTVNYQDKGSFQEMIRDTDFQASAFYTTGYAVTKDVTDMYMDTVESFGRKAGAGEWLAFGKYVSSDTEFDGGSSSRGYDGDITGTIGMLEYGVNDTTSYGVVFGKGDTKVDITGGGNLDGDNTYIGGYVKHTTEGGIELLGNIGLTKSDLDAKFSTHDTVGGVNYNIISDGSSDADAITLSLKAKKPYSISETLRVEPMLGARYTLINQDAVESSDRNFRIDERDVTVLEGMAGADLVKDFSVANGKLSLKTGVEVSLLSVSDSDDARYTLYGNEIALVNEEEIADSKVSAHVGFGYEHENGVGVDARYKFIWTDKGDSNRAEVGLSYRF